jgi:hypothetical protein
VSGERYTGRLVVDVSFDAADDDQAREILAGLKRAHDLGGNATVVEAVLLTGDPPEPVS